MTTFNTGNPVGSSAAKDLFDNAENLDDAMNSVMAKWRDRLGVERPTWTGLEADFRAFVDSNRVYGFPTWAAAAAAVAAGQVPVQSEVNIVGDTGTHVDPVSGATVSNNGRFVMTAAGLEWRSADVLSEKANEADLLAAEESIRVVASKLSAANVLPDAFNEHVFEKGRVFGGRTWFDTNPTYASSPNLSLSTPVLNGTGGASEVRKFFTKEDIAANPGDSLVVKVLAWFGAVNGFLSVLFVDGSNNAVGAQASVTLAGVAGIQRPSVTIPVPSANWARMRVIVSSPSGGVQVGAYAAAVGVEPEFVRAEMSGRLKAAAQFSQNILVDPFLRDLGNAIGARSAYFGTYSATASNSPYGGGSITGGAQCIRRVDLGAYGIKPGEVVSARFGVYKSTDDVSCRLVFRDAANGQLASFSAGNIGSGTGMFDRMAYGLVPTQAVAIDFIVDSSSNAARELVGTALCRGYGWPALAEAAPQLDYLRGLVPPPPAREEPAIYGAEFMTRTLRKVGSLLTPPTGSSVDNVYLSIACMGDSWTQPAQRWVRNLTGYLALALGDGGPGYYGFLYDGSSANQPMGNARSVFNGAGVNQTAWTYSRTGSWADVDNGKVAPDLGSITSTTVGARVDVGWPASPVTSAVKLFYIGAGAGVVRYSWDGGSSWTTLDVSGAAETLYTASLTGFPVSGAVTLRIEVVSGTVALAGVDVRGSITRGVRVNKLGNLGSRALDWAAVNPGEWGKSVAAIDLDVAFVMLGTNDQGASRSASQYASDIGTTVGNIRAANPACDIVLMTPCENQRINSVSMASYAAATRELARSLRCTHVNLQPFFGAIPADYSDLLMDPTHPSDAGSRVILEVVRRLLMT